MKLMRFAVAAATISLLSVAYAGPALASDVTLGETGPDSTQTINIESAQSLDISNTSVVTVDSTNVQDASTGDGSADKNTTVSAGGSGGASNDNSTSTTVTLGNGDTSSAPAGAADGLRPAGGKGGSVLGAATGAPGAGAAVLPEVGAEFPVDVSALRNAWNPQTAAPTAQLVDRTAGLRMALLVLAAVMTLIGIAGSFVYARRPVRQV
jgi:hypothetical protein